MTDPTFYAAATASALLAIAAALLFALRARDAERALRDAERSRDAQLRENGRLRGLCQSADADLATTREELRQAKLALVAAEAELDLVRQEALDTRGALVVDSSSSRRWRRA